MKLKSKIIGSILLAPAVMLYILFITALAEIIFQDGDMAWLLELIICITAIPLLLLLERKVESGKFALECNVAYFTSAVFLAVPVFGLVVLYVDNLQGRLNPWDHGWFSGIQWIGYVLTVYAQVVLHLIIRIIIFAVTRIRAERKIADKEKYGDEE